jgi:hypothetical protein
VKTQKNADDLAMTTPIEVHAGARVLGQIKHAATYIFQLGKRIATLEGRVTILEAALAKQPADACPFCGERAMRKTVDGRLFGGAPNQWKEDSWTCNVCNQTEKRVIRF